MMERISETDKAKTPAPDPWYESGDEYGMRVLRRDETHERHQQE
jgi:hypothetical protein